MKFFETKKAGRKTAEIITFSFSIALLLGIAYFLLQQSQNHNHSDYLSITSSLDFDHVKKEGDTYILPLKIHNNGKTVARAQIHVDLGEEESPRERTIELTYLDKEGSQTIYLTLQHEPKKDSINVTPLFYYFD